MAAALGVAFLLRLRRIRTFWPYIIAGGALSWTALFWGGLHPALALVPVIPFLPHAARDPGLFVEAPPGAHDPLSQFEHWWKLPVQGILFLFGLVNAGVEIGTIGTGTWAVFIALLIGKPVGIGLAVAICRRGRSSSAATTRLERSDRHRIARRVSALRSPSFSRRPRFRRDRCSIRPSSARS